MRCYAKNKREHESAADGSTEEWPSAMSAVVHVAPGKVLISAPDGKGLYVHVLKPAVTR